jgi:uncharacterized protein YdaU (DUF1376 family)
MPLFIDAYLADTTHFSAEEHGAYLLLLMAMWRRNGRVPDNDKDLARICCVHPSRWSRVKKRLIPLLIQRDGELRQKKLTAVFSDLINKKSQKRASGQPSETKKTNGLDGAPSRDAHGTRARDLSPSPDTFTDVNVSAHARDARQFKKSMKKTRARSPPPQTLSDAFMEDYVQLLSHQGNGHVTAAHADQRHLAASNGSAEIAEPDPAGEIADETADRT